MPRGGPSRIEKAEAESDIILVNAGKKMTMSRSAWETNKEFIGEDISLFRLASEIYLNGIVKQLQAKGFNARAEQLIG